MAKANGMDESNEFNEEELEAAEGSTEESSVDPDATDDEMEDADGGTELDDGNFPAKDYGDARHRGWFVMRSYTYDCADANSPYHGVPVEKWIEEVSKEWQAIGDHEKTVWLQFIVHDKDIIRKGKKEETKPVHMHAVVRFEDNKTQSAAMKLFCGNNTRVNNVQPVLSTKGGYKSALLYLTHHTDSAYREHKTWYHWEKVTQVKERYVDLIASDTKHRVTGKVVEALLEECIDGIMEGTAAFKTMREKFIKMTSNRGYLKYKKEFESAFEEYRTKLWDAYVTMSLTGKFHKVTTYIAGPGRVGKSLLADLLALAEHDEDNIFKPAGGGSDKITDDFIDGHGTERATVFHDLSPKVYSKRSWFTMLDPRNWAPTRSRGKVKPWFSTSVYMAVNLPLGEFLIQMITKGDSQMDITTGNADDIIMSLGRVARYLVYGEHNGQPVVWVYHLKPERDWTSKQDLAKKWRKNRPFFSDDVVYEFYQTVGYVPYDPSAPVFAERDRMAKVIAKVYAEGTFASPEYVEVDGLPEE